jgi:hypothetical protein
VRIAAAGGATRGNIAGDLAPLFSHKIAAAEWRHMAEREAGELVATRLATETRGRLTATEEGVQCVARYLGQRSLASCSWAELRDVSLVAKGLGLERGSSIHRKALGSPDGLRTLIVQKAFGLPMKKNQPPARLRSQLAVIALERAFGNKIKAGLGKGSSLSAKTGRLLAGQLLRDSRELATDARLLASLAAEQVGAAGADLDPLRAAILRRLGARVLDESASQAGPAAPAKEGLERARDATPAANAAPAPAPSPPRSVRPGLDEFARSVKRAAATHAEGWPGSRKAYISHVWQAIRTAEPRWGLSEIEFKCMLAEAHRLGALVLANADLKSKRNIEELESSAVPYKNAVWHYVRVEE